MWTNHAGELSTRPGMDELCQLGDGARRIPRGGLSVKAQFVDSNQHYILMGRTVSGNEVLQMHVIEENLSPTLRKQVLNLGPDIPVRAMTGAVVNGELIISGPDLPTLWGYTGSGIVIAKKELSVNPALQTLDIPHGICVAWATRCVIAQGEALFI